MDSIRVALTVALAFALAVPGCLVGDEPSAQAHPDPSPSPSAAGGGNGTGGTAPARIVLHAQVNVTGLHVALAFNATAPGNGTLAWQVAFGDNASANGTLVPAVQGPGMAWYNGSANHTYAAGGAYNLTLTVSQGNLTADRAVQVNATGAAPATPMDPLALSGSCTTGVADGSHAFEVLPGQALIHAEIDIGGGGVDLDWSLVGPDGSEADAAESFTPAAEGPLDTEAPAAGTWTIEVSCFLGVAATYDIAVRFS